MSEPIEEPPDESIAPASGVVTASGPLLPAMAELGVVLAMAVVPPLVHALMFEVPRARTDATAFATLSLLRSFQVIAVVLFVMARAPDGWAAFGLVRPQVRDLAAAIALFVLSLFVWYGVGGFLGAAGIVPERSPSNLFPVVRGAAWWLVGPACLANGFAEESVMRGFLIRRLETLGIRTGLAIAVTSTAFGAYHLYQGAYAALLSVAFGVVMGAAFVRSRRLWPIALCHALQDAIALAQMAG